MLTPIIADELKGSSKTIHETWIKEAIKEAASLNKRNWRYIARILEHWSSEGKNGGKYRRNIKRMQTRTNISGENTTYVQR